MSGAHFATPRVAPQMIQRPAASGRRAGSERRLNA